MKPTVAGIAIAWHAYSTLCSWHCAVFWAYPAIVTRGLPSFSLVLLSLVVLLRGLNGMQKKDDIKEPHSKSSRLL